MSNETTRLDRAPSPPPPKRHHPRQPVPRLGPVNSEAWELLKRATPEQIKAASWIGLTTGESWRALEWMVDGMPKRAKGWRRHERLK